MFEAISRESRKLSTAVALEIVAILFLLTGGSFLQVRWGLTGLALSQLFYLALSVAVALVQRTPIREMFPVKRVSFREIAGIFVFAGAGILLSLLANGLTMFIFPAAAQDLAEISEFLYPGNGVFIMILVAAVVPAVCEEAYFRGAILSNLRVLNRDWAMILITGIFFGLFHVSVFKFLSTAVFGAMLAWIVVKRDNILLAMLMHFLNNSFSVLAGTLVGSAGEAASAVQNVNMLQILASYCIVAFASPLLLVWGITLIHPEPRPKKIWIIAGGCSLFLLAAGALVTTLT